MQLSRAKPGNPASVEYKEIYIFVIKTRTEDLVETEMFLFHVCMHTIHLACMAAQAIILGKEVGKTLSRQRSWN